MGVTKQEYDVTGPVEVEDGRRLTISWNRSDDPQQVAVLFSQANAIPPAEIPQIAHFVQHATAVTAPAGSANTSDSQTADKGGNDDDMGAELSEAGASNGQADVCEEAVKQKEAELQQHAMTLQD